MTLYIRYNDSIYEVIKEDDEYFYVYEYDYENHEKYIKNISKSLVDDDHRAFVPFKLCDKFVLVDPKDSSCTYIDSDLDELVRYRRCCWNSRGDIYGAIWTKKGLIFVLKYIRLVHYTNIESAASYDYEINFKILYGWEDKE